MGQPPLATGNSDTLKFKDLEDTKILRSSFKIAWQDLPILESDYRAKQSKYGIHVTQSSTRNVRLHQ